MAHRYHAIQGRANNYQVYQERIPESTSPKKRTRTITEPDSRDLEKITARLTASGVILKMDVNAVERLEILESLQLEDSVFHPEILKLILREEEKEKLAYWRKQLSA